MSQSASPRRTSRGIFSLAAFTLSATVIYVLIAAVVAGAPSTRAPLDAVFRLEALGCKRNPTRTVGTVVTDPLGSGGQLVLTVAHGVVGQDTIEIVAGNTRVPMRIVAVDSEWDLAVLQALTPLLGDDAAPLKGVRFAEGRVGNSAFVVFEETTESRATAPEVREVASVRPAFVAKRLRIRTEDIYLLDVDTRGARPGFEVRTAAFVGDSGGPLFDTNGDMVGLVWGTSRKSADRSWATRVQAAIEMIESATAELRGGENASFESLNLLACAP